ncbi:DUF4381 domain-containing protein [Maricurvus nonylphenolicus]|uniref:DUF4381 domain-containing protein n=1 Tax=Maricurvus nonylphenolicus TaxID=1008307 RepID=UPI0036F2B711
MPPLNTQMPQQQDPLAQLKDIHLPDAISAWPPAPGWWILAAILVAFVIWGGIWFAQQKKINRYRQQALQELQQLNYQDNPLTDINALLKRVAMVAYPDHQVASLNGDQWVNFLHSSCPQLSADTFTLLAQGPYQDPSKLSAADIDTLKTRCTTWIKMHSAQAIQQANSIAEAA